MNAGELPDRETLARMLREAQAMLLLLQGLLTVAVQRHGAIEVTQEALHAAQGKGLEFERNADDSVLRVFVGQRADREGRATVEILDERRCRVCGCTERTACGVMSRNGKIRACHWTQIDLCSACDPTAGAAEGGAH